jgi:hypothetical protein
VPDPSGRIGVAIGEFDLMIDTHAVGAVASDPQFHESQGRRRSEVEVIRRPHR